MILTCAIFATILNIEGSNCITKINSVAKEHKINKTGQQPQLQINQNQSAKENGESFELVQYCFLVTNLFVYSLYGIIIGILIITVLYMKYKRIWSKTAKKIDK